MKRTTFILFLFVMACVFTWGYRAFGQDTSCVGIERWNVKTLQDPDVNKIDFEHYQYTTVEQLLRLRRPRRLPANGRVSPVETTVYTMQALLVGYKHEVDGDFHIVVADLNAPDDTMVVEVPAARCANPHYADAFNYVRKFLLTQVGRPRGAGRMFYLPKPVPITVTGVGFWDFWHHQTGAPRTAIELHPLISIEAEK